MTSVGALAPSRNSVCLSCYPSLSTVPSLPQFAHPDRSESCHVLAGWFAAGSGGDVWSTCVSSSHFSGDTVDVDEGVSGSRVCWLSRLVSGEGVSMYVIVCKHP